MPFGGIDLVDGAVEALEWAVGDVDDFADGEVDLVLGLFQAHALLDLFDFILPTGVGSVPLPTKPVTDGVLRTMYQASSDIFIWTRT